MWASKNISPKISEYFEVFQFSKILFLRIMPVMCDLNQNIFVTQCTNWLSAASCESALISLFSLPFQEISIVLSPKKCLQSFVKTSLCFMTNCFSMTWTSERFSQMKCQIPGKCSLSHQEHVSIYCKWMSKLFSVPFAGVIFLGRLSLHDNNT